MWRVQRPPPAFPSAKYVATRYVSAERAKAGLTLSVRPQVLLYSSLHVSRSVLSWMQDDHAGLMKELWQAVAWPRDAGHTCVSAELCRLLFPEGANLIIIEIFGSISIKNEASNK